MGGGTFDYSSSSARANVRKTTGASAYFKHDASARAGTAPKLHPTLDFKLKPQREARDSADNPNSTPIAVLCDVTGSMSQIPKFVIDDLHKLMRLILDDGVVTDPHILFGGIGDATCDDVPVQLGEFEADDELVESHLANIYLERGGGGQVMESYELFMWIFANRVFTDAYEKRGNKGYLFIIGDEAPYDVIRKDLVQEYLGCKIEKDLPLRSQDDGHGNIEKGVAEALQEKWNVFCIRPGGTSHFDSPVVQKSWTDILPEERVLKVENWEKIVPYIAATISVMAGKSLNDTIASLKNSGFDDMAVDDLVSSLVPLERTTLPVITGEDAILAHEGDAAVHGERL